MTDEDVPRELAEILGKANLESLERIKEKAICLTGDRPYIGHNQAIPSVPQGADS